MVLKFVCFCVYMNCRLMLHLLCSGIICLFLIGFMAKIQCWSLKLFWSLKFKAVTFSPIDDMTKN